MLNAELIDRYVYILSRILKNMPEDQSEYIPPETSSSEWYRQISSTLDEYVFHILHQHTKFGNALFRPPSIFSGATVEAAMRTKIDEVIRKIGQHKDNCDKERELIDTLIGYLINFRAYMSVHDPDTWGSFF